MPPILRHLAALAFTAFTARAVPALADDAAAVQDTLRTLYPATRVDQVVASAIPGLFEVTMGPNVAYIDRSGRYFVFGHLYDMRTQRDLTAERKDGLGRVDFAALPLADAIKTVTGAGRRVVAVFSDPDCPYCKALERELAQIDDLTVYTFLYPLAAMHPEARSRAVAVWCAPDRAAAWRALMQEGKAPPVAECAHPVERNVALAESLNIRGTPTLVAPDGRVRPGAGPASEIAAWLTRGAAPVAITRTRKETTR